MINYPSRSYVFISKQIEKSKHESNAAGLEGKYQRAYSGSVCFFSLDIVAQE
jgi:hypothetical protein